MGYLYAIISVLLGNAKGYCGKKSSGYLRSDRDAVLVNAGRMLLCTVFGFLIALAGGVSFAMEEGELWIFLLSAVPSGWESSGSTKRSGGARSWGSACCWRRRI